MERGLRSVFFLGEEDFKDLEGFPSALRVDLVGWIVRSNIKEEEQCLI